jgi:hypothetical protein
LRRKRLVEEATIPGLGLHNPRAAWPIKPSPPNCENKLGVPPSAAKLRRVAGRVSTSVARSLEIARVSVQLRTRRLARLSAPSDHFPALERLPDLAPGPSFALVTLLDFWIFSSVGHSNDLANLLSWHSLKALGQPTRFIESRLRFLQ